jgi:hypothetical protein
MVQLRDVIAEEIETRWAGKMRPPRTALDEAVARGNTILRPDSAVRQQMSLQRRGAHRRPGGGCR